MVRIRHFSVCAIFALLLVSFEETSALKCWRCSSETSNASFCNDPLDVSKISDQQKRWSYVECSVPPDGSETRAVCRKVKEIVNEEVVFWRSCYWENEDAPNNACMNTTTPSYVKREFCETCSTDGCNI